MGQTSHRQSKEDCLGPMAAAASQVTWSYGAKPQPVASSLSLGLPGLGGSGQ